MRSPVVVGRDIPLTTLDARAEEAVWGRGTVVLVRGEPGVGKSRVLAESLARARRAGLMTLTDRAVEGSGPFRALSDALLARQRETPLPEPAAIGAFAGVLGRLVPGWAPVAVGDPVPDLPLLISEGLLRLLRLIGERGGAVLALDDVHWADDDTLTVLDRIADADAALPVLVVLASARSCCRPAARRTRRLPPRPQTAYKLPLLRATVLDVLESAVGRVTT